MTKAKLNMSSDRKSPWRTSTCHGLFFHYLSSSWRHICIKCFLKRGAGVNYQVAVHCDLCIIKFVSIFVISMIGQCLECKTLVVQKFCIQDTWLCLKFPSFQELSKRTKARDLWFLLSINLYVQYANLYHSGSLNYSNECVL